MFEQELIMLMEEFGVHEEIMNPFKYNQNPKGDIYYETKKQQYNSQFMRNIRFKQFLSMPQTKPFIERLKVALFDEIEPQVLDKLEDTLSKAIDELNLGR